MRNTIPTPPAVTGHEAKGPRSLETQGAKEHRGYSARNGGVAIRLIRAASAIVSCSA